MRKLAVFFVAILALASTRGVSSQEGDVAPVSTATAARLAGAALVDDVAWKRLEHLCDRIGHRLSGSDALERAIDWAVAEMQKDGLENVRREKVMVPRWVRGQESAELVEPVARPLSMLGLGNSVGTPAEGIAGEVVVVHDWKELEALGPDAVKGKIVLYDAPFTTYGDTVPYRAKGAVEASKRGAVAALVRSVGPVSLKTPHTGSLRYQEGVAKIPAAALSIEDSETIVRLARNGRVVVRLRMEARMLEDVESANVVAEVRGREKPDEVVLVSGHLDSWDVGTGASDDGVGCLAAWEAVRLVKKLDLRPRRTIRVVLFTNEENGLRGAQAYRQTHETELDKHVLAIEADLGAAKPTGFGLTDDAPAATRAAIREIASVLRGLALDRIDPNGGGADVGPLLARGVPVMGLATDPTHYFDIHHTHADTLDKVDRVDFGKCAAAMAVMAHGVADHPRWPLDRVPPHADPKYR